jgi:hypothetical protein
MTCVCRLAREHNVAQERGEIAGHGRKGDVQKANVTPPIAADIGLSRKEIHEVPQNNARLGTRARTRERGSARRRQAQTPSTAQAQPQGHPRLAVHREQEEARNPGNPRLSHLRHPPVTRQPYGPPGDLHAAEGEG